jgi:hypothetical protein
MMDCKDINPLTVHYSVDNDVSAFRELVEASVFKKINQLTCERICF